MKPPLPLIFPHAVLFDMDGTLTEPMLNFPAIKKEMGIGQQPILEALAAMDAMDRERAEHILHRHEDLAANASTLNPGCAELFRTLANWKIPTALITRNSRRSTMTVLARHGLKLDVLITREDPPFKPSPAPLLTACRQLQVEPSATWMIGDGQYDIEAAASAGIASIWISHGKPRPFTTEPQSVVRDLIELSALLTALASTSSCL